MVPRIISPHAQFLCMGFYCAGRHAEMSAGAVNDKAPCTDGRTNIKDGLGTKAQCPRSFFTGNAEVQRQKQTAERGSTAACGKIALAETA